MKGAWRFWVELTSEREPPLVLALFRIALGLCAIGSLLSAATSRVLGDLWVDRAFGGALSLGDGSPLVSVLGGPTPAVMWSVFAVAMAAAVLVTVGLGGRAPAFVGAHAYFALVRTNGETAGGYDSMIGNALFLLFLSGAATTLSVDCRIKRGRWTSDDPVPAWPRYLLVFQLVVIYTATGLQKISPVWTPFGGYSALYWVYQEPTWRRFDMSWVADVYPLFQIATAVTWHWEIAAPLLLVYSYFDRTRERGGRLRRLFTRFDLRKPFASIGAVLHLGILTTLNVGPFSFVSLAYYLALLRPEEARAALHAIGARLAPFRWIRSSPPSSA